MFINSYKEEITVPTGQYPPKGYPFRRVIIDLCDSWNYNEQTWVVIHGVYWWKDGKTTYGIIDYDGWDTDGRDNSEFNRRYTFRVLRRGIIEHRGKEYNVRPPFKKYSIHYW